MPENQDIAIVILAAGASSRMQRIKQLLPWGKGTLLGNAIKVASQSNSKAVYVVLGANAEAIRTQITTEVEWVENSNWAKGMGTSISCAMNYLKQTKEVFDGVLLMVCDQPLIDTDYLNKMITFFKSSKNGIVATAYKNKSGVPALFPKMYFKKLANLDGNLGAQEILAENSNNIININPKGKEGDLDTWDEYKQALKKIGPNAY